METLPPCIAANARGGWRAGTAMLGYHSLLPQQRFEPYRVMGMRPYACLDIFLVIHLLNGAGANLFLVLGVNRHQPIFSVPRV